MGKKTLLLVLAVAVVAGLCAAERPEVLVGKKAPEFDLFGVDYRYHSLADYPDAKAVVVLSQESQINREDVVVIGISCEGVGDPLLGKCGFCDVRTPKNCDIVIGSEVAPLSKDTQFENVDEFESEAPGGSIKFVCWDIGGQITFRDALWTSYMSGSMGVIYVVDSAAHHRFDEAKQELWRYVIDNKGVKDIPILVLANKQDLEGAASAGHVARALDLHKVTTHSYAIFPTSAKSGFNLEEALEWLRQRILEKMDEPD